MKHLLAVILTIALPLIGHGQVVENFKAHTQFLASDEMGGRGVGSVGNRLAAEYIAKQFKDIGVRALPIEFGRIHTPDDEINAHWSWDGVEDNIVLYKAISDYFLSHPDGITVTDSALFQN